MSVETAVQNKDAVCAAAAAGRTAFLHMESTDAAKTYMQLALLATKARDARATIDAANQAAAEVTAKHTAAQQSQADAIASRALALASKLAADAEDVKLTNSANFNIAADRGNARALLVNGRDSATHASDCVQDANDILGVPAGSGAAANDAALQAQTRSDNAMRSANLMQGTVFAPAPASCTNRGAYDAHVVTLTADIAGIAAETAALPVPNQQLGAAVVVSRAALATQRANLQPLIITDTQHKGRALYAPAALIPLHSQNAFDAAIVRCNGLARDGNTLAAQLPPIATASAQALTPLVAPAAALSALLAPLSARMLAIEQAAQAASLLIPYDPAANSTDAMTALTQKDAADAAMAALQQDLGNAEQAVVVAARRVDAEKMKVSQRLPNKPLQDAQRDVLKKRMAVKSAVIKARSELSFIGAIIAPCFAEAEAVQRSRTSLAAAEAEQARLEALPTGLQEAERALAAAQADVDAITQSVAIAQPCANTARTSARSATDRRIDQLMAEGHGPQRHEGAPTERTLGERALYCIDPETHTQLDVESGGAHAADLNASKIKTKADYVKAEALARAALVPGEDVARFPLTNIGPNVAQGITCGARGGKSVTSLGPDEVLTVPVLPPYVYGAGTPPPTAAEMDTAQMSIEIARHTRATVFAPNAEAFAVLRPDINNKIYLRTMWPQNPA